MITHILISLIRIYQKTEGIRNGIMRQLHVPRHECKITPNCSQNMIIQIQGQGVIRGVYSGLGQMLRCR